MTPVALADFWSGLKITTEDPQLPEVAEINRTAGGEVTVSSLGARLWRSTVAIAPLYLDDGRVLQARLRRLVSPGMTFLAMPVVGRRPLLDPLGGIAASTVTISSISADRTALALAGMPPGYTLSIGDFLSTDVAGIPHMHQMDTIGAADATGVTPLIGVVPALRTSIAAGAAVTLVDPTYKALLDPASVKEGRNQKMHLTGVSFRLMQTLR